MHTTSLPRFAPILAAAALLAGGFILPASAATFPPLNTPATTAHIPGKLVWADLFTTDPDGATRFYCGLLGWTSSPIEQKGKTYVIFSNDGTPVAGLVPRSVTGPGHPSRWIGFYSVEDIAVTLADVADNGGTVRAPSRNFPDRGYQAIVSDKDHVPIGLLQSTSGDPLDDPTRVGSWNWFELYVNSPKDTSDFYHNAIGFDVAPETHSDRKGDFVLSSEGQARGGIAPLVGTIAKPSWLGIIRVADLDKTLALVAGLGGEVLVAPHPVEFGSRFAIVLDPTGGTIGLVQYADDANPSNNP
jgi:predicted enzyme related to lactoylglutathione lyase